MGSDESKIISRRARDNRFGSLVDTNDGERPGRRSGKRLASRKAEARADDGESLRVPSKEEDLVGAGIRTSDLPPGHPAARERCEFTQVVLGDSGDYRRRWRRHCLVGELRCEQEKGCDQCASPQLLPEPISTSIGTDRARSGSAAVDITRRMTSLAASTLSSAASKTSSS